MWPLDKRNREQDLGLPSDGGEFGESEESVALVDPSAAIPAALSTGDPTMAAGNIAEPVRRQWRAQLAALGGPSPLLHFEDTPRTRIELSATHPGGLPQFITGKSTLLSHLIRDELALRNAKLAAAAITQKGIELRSVRGIESVHLAIGLASWRLNGAEYLAPVLLRPLAIRRYGKDFELKLKGKPFLNPALARALAEQFQLDLDAESFVSLAITNGIFKPQPVIDRLRGLTAHVPLFSVSPRLVVSSFAEVGPAMAADAVQLNHPVIDAVAGVASARSAIQSRLEQVDIIDPDRRPPATNTLVLDADPEQEQVVTQIASGTSLVVKTLPGTGGTQTIVNAIGALLAQNKRILVAGARASSLDGIAHRLEQVGLSGVAVRTPTLRRDLIFSISRNENAQKPRVADIDEALVRLRGVLLDYKEALSDSDPVLGCSAFEALQKLSTLSSRPAAPATTVRLDRTALEAVATQRDRIAADLSELVSLGEFRYGPGDSPWYGAAFASSDEAHVTHQLAKKLSGTELPGVLERARSLIDQTKLRAFESVAELGVFLRLLLDIRDTLDRFQPAVYDRPLSELIAATSPRRESSHLSGPNRRRLRKLAHEYLRPGVHVTDINGALRRIQQQRTLWQRYSEAGTVPAVPVGIADVWVAYQKLVSDLSALDRPLGHIADHQLAVRPIPRLVQALRELATDSDVLANLQERSALAARLREFGLGPLLVDLSRRHVPENRVVAEFELSWWQSALESMLEYNKALLGANTGVLDRLEADFRLVDEAHTASIGAGLAWRLAEAWKIAVIDWPGEAEHLRRLLRADQVTPAAVGTGAPHLLRTLAPVWLASSYEVSSIDESINFDSVILVDAGATTFAENLGAIRRAKQVVAFGDPVTQTSTEFIIGVSEKSAADPAPSASPLDNADIDALHADSALARLGDLLPTLTLTRSYRAGGEDLAELVNTRFYGGQINSLPWAGTFLGHGSLSLHYVNGNGLPDSVTGAVESVDAEVNKVVELVLEHALKRPRESLMVITASDRHAARVHQAVLAAFAKRTDLTDFILTDRAEPFAVLTLEQAVAQGRDRVIFSVGYGRTPHGRLLSDFGPLSRPGGERLLAVGMTRARRSTDIVACFQPGDIDVERQQYGVVALANVLDQTEKRGAYRDESESADPMLADLAARLTARGIRVAAEYRGKLSFVAAAAGRAVVVETDSVFTDLSLRESLRLRPSVLRRLGWYYLRVHSFELFANPEAVADRIVDLLHRDRESVPAPQLAATST